jgi:choline-sulfatase
MLKAAVCLFLLVLTGCSKSNQQNGASNAAAQMPAKPNIIVILTDQERYPIHWPQGWVMKNLPSTARLQQHGLTFNRAYAASSECSPSRAVLMTSEYSPINQVPHTPPVPSLPSAKQLMDIGSLLKEQAGYEVVWKGKWHLNIAVDGDYQWSEEDIANLQNRYDISQWNPPDAGNAGLVIQPVLGGGTFPGLSTIGGGYANNDGRYLQGMSNDDPKQTPGYGESVLDYLAKVKAIAPDQRKPFCLFISLVNPHDVWVYPTAWQEAGYQQEEFSQLGIDLPSNFADDLTTKPSIQLRAREAYNARSPLQDAIAEMEYINFYAYLHKVVDNHIEMILNTLDAAGLTENTIIFRTTDHGELGLSHGMRGKAYTAYEEMIHIPFIVSNPLMYSSPQTTDAFYCHLDLLPTLAELVGLPRSSDVKGVSMVPVLKNPSTSVQDAILFAYDDIFSLPPTTPGGHIRALREGDWTYAVYYSEDGSHFEYEMYNIFTDPGQLTNLLHGTVAPENAVQAQRLHAKLKAKIDATQALPPSFPWPTTPF